jgi:PAS domain S-box-containing protein
VSETPGDDILSDVELTLIHAPLLGDAVDEAPYAIFVADDEMRYITVNRTACDLLGYTRAELIRLTIPDLDASAAARDAYRSLVRDGSAAVRTRLARKDGSSVAVEIVGSRTRVAGISAYVAFVVPVEE